jgi:starch synthase (maltosyl-transferring)
VYFLDLHTPRQFLSGCRHLSRLLADQRPDLVQSFLFHANVLAALTGRRQKIRRIVLGMRVADPSRWRMQIERHAARLADRVVCVSESVAQVARDQIRIPANRVCVIPNGIAISEYDAVLPIDPQELGVRPRRRLIAVVGRLHAQKGPDWLLHVAPRMLAEFADVDLVFVGHGPEEPALRRQASESGIADRVHFTGWRSDVPAILRSSALLVLPSRWEGMPNAILEAMAVALPVVATRVEGVEELLGPSSESQMVEFGDDEALARKVASILRDPRFAHELGQQNRARVLQHFSFQHMIAHYQSLYDELLDSR